MAESSTKPFSGIFVCYRREDSAGHTGRLSDKLVERFGRERIFMDIDTIEPGEDFVTVIENAIGSCEILIAVIGREWLSPRGETPRYMDNPNDFVRLEIASALSRDIRVIPVLVKRASMPKPQDLPDDIAKFTRRNAVELSDNDWQNDVDQLIRVVERVLRQRAEAGSQVHEETQTWVDPLAITIASTPSPAVPLSESHATSDILDPTPPGEDRGKRTMLLVIIASISVLATVVVIWMKLRPVGEQQTANRQASTQQTSQTTSAPPPTAAHPPSGMVYVPGGEFMMGRDDGGENNINERPAHLVSVGGFFIDQHEVTCDEYSEFIQTGYPAPPDWVDGKVPNGAARKPVTNVKWDDADAYCNKYGKRLAREEEWELAARGTKRYIYPWGNVWEARLANVHTKELTEAGKFPGLSPYGALDMVGNAWEWTVSSLTPYPNGTLSEQPAPDSKVIRGGSYRESPSEATTTYRVGYPARSATDYSKIGFRCVSDAPHTSKPQ